ncbi:alkyl sulfatase dimerization domain-containing protein [Vibrio breoganii]
MKKTYITTAMCLLFFGATTGSLTATASPSDVSKDALSYLNDNSAYYQGKRATKTAENGALISDGMYQSIIDPVEKQGSYLANQQTSVKVAEGVYTYNIGSIINIHAVETKNGLIIYDTGDSLHEGELFYNLIRKDTDKPIKAIIYSHEHYVGGAQYFIDAEAKRGNKDIKIIGHWNHNDSYRASAAGAALHKEVSDVLLPRALQQFYVLTDQEGPRASGHTHFIDITAVQGPIDVDTPIETDGQSIIIDGTEMVFYIDAIGTDTAYQTMVHFPESDILMSNIMWGFFPNLYSIRGGSYRNPELWVGALEKMEALQPKVLLNTHSKSTNSVADSQKAIHAYQDAISAVLNQTMFNMLQGNQRTVAAHNVKVPDVIVDEPHLRQNYGELETMITQIYSAILGSYDGIAADAIPFHPTAEADMIVRGMGGQDKTLEFAKGELKAGNFQYAVQLGKHLVNYNSEHQASVDFYIDALYAMAESTESHNLRSWYLTQARMVKGEIALPSVLPANPQVVAADVVNFVDNFRVRLDYKAAGETRAKIGFQFESGKSALLEIRNGVSYTRDSLEGADVIIKMNDATFAKLFNNMSDVQGLVESGEASIETGSLEEANKLMNLYAVLYDWENDDGLQFVLKMMK